MKNYDNVFRKYGIFGYFLSVFSVFSEFVVTPGGQRAADSKKPAVCAAGDIFTKNLSAYFTVEVFLCRYLLAFR